jgi:acyl carrier protein
MMEDFIDYSSYYAIFYKDNMPVWCIEMIRTTEQGAHNFCKRFKKYNLIWDRYEILDLDTVVIIMKESAMKKEPEEFLKEILTIDFRLPISDIKKITVETHISEIGIDSLEIYNLLFNIENNYRIRFSNHFLPTTVGDLVEEINRLRALK